ncbi:hypothetical protein [Mucilaginibacter rubeus]|nr:hypothetical protein [Mucilaginibacter rubeus]
MTQRDDEEYSYYNPHLVVTGLLVAFGGLIAYGAIIWGILIIIRYL